MRIVFLGCGRIAARHARLLRRHRGRIELGFASRDPARADAFASRFGGKAYPSYEAAMSAPDVDVTAIVTPPASHLHLALAALGAGKDVVIEKPPVPRAADIDRLEAEAARAGRQVLVAENFEYKPVLASLRRLIAEGAVGDPLFVQINAVSSHHRPGDWRSEPQLALGGALYEGGIHWIHLIAGLGLDVRHVQAVRPAPADDQPLERSMLVTFDFAGGASGTLSHSWDAGGPGLGLHRSWIIGRRGKIVFESHGSWIICRGDRNRLLLPGLRDRSGFAAMWADFIAALTTGANPRMNLAAARRDLELIEAAYASARLDRNFMTPSSSLP